MKKIITILILAMTISIQAEGLVSQDTTSTKITNKIPIGKVIRTPKGYRLREGESLTELAERLERAEAAKRAHSLANTNQPGVFGDEYLGYKGTYSHDTTEEDLKNAMRHEMQKDAGNIITIIVLAVLIMFALHKASKHLTVK